MGSVAVGLALGVTASVQREDLAGSNGFAPRIQEAVETLYPYGSVLCEFDDVPRRRVVIAQDWPPESSVCPDGGCYCISQYSNGVWQGRYVILRREGKAIER